MIRKAGGIEIQRCTECFVMSSIAGLESAQNHGPIVLIIKGQEGKRIEFLFFPRCEIRSSRGGGACHLRGNYSATAPENILGHK